MSTFPYVNMRQTQEERREKYAYARSLGLHYKRAMQWRDFEWSTIQRWLDYFSKHPIEAEELGINLDKI